MSFELHNRRYTGSKLKLSQWICDLIRSNCDGNSFTDIFAGTASISYKMLNYFDQITINDNLYSNKVIYESFFGKGKYSVEKINNARDTYSKLESNRLKENYVSVNFGNKFFSKQDAKKIGFIRQDIEKRRKYLSSKEYNILLASLLYSMDRCANTVGHYDAYIKGKTKYKEFVFDTITPVDVEKNKITILTEDANALSRKIKTDIVYIDPPYNSRQYSRFYHVLENIAKWDKPILFGVAMKPRAENMSVTCPKILYHFLM